MNAKANLSDDGLTMYVDVSWSVNEIQLTHEQAVVLIAAIQAELPNMAQKPLTMNANQQPDSSSNVRKLRAALESQIAWWEQIPAGPDYDADPDNCSPDDASSHLAGLAIREARLVLEKTNPKNKSL